MNKIGKRLYYDVTTGNVIVDTGEKRGAVVQTTIEQDISVYTALSERNRETFDVLELDYGQYSQDFRQAIGYKVNPETKKIEFSYPDPNAPAESQPYQPPLSEQMAQIKRDMDNAIIELTTAMSMGGGA